MNLETPVTSHELLPDGVPLVASFHDDRNRLSYYYPRLEHLGGVTVPDTLFVGVDHRTDRLPNFDGRLVTDWLQRRHEQEAFVRTDYTSAKIEPEAGSHIYSQDAHDIESTANELFAQCAMMERRIGGRIAIREWIPHDEEIRYFARFGEVVYRGVAGGDIEAIEDPSDWQAEQVASEFDEHAWSIDFIRHKETGKWYCIDMGLDGLYPREDEWIAISEHVDESYSPERQLDAMVSPQRVEQLVLEP